MRWFTCTPRNFPGGPAFSARDTGLLCCGFRSIGVDSMAVLPGPAYPDDTELVIRASMQELADAQWWRALNLDGVVFYNWGEAEYKPISDAIMAAGIRLASASDTHGVASPLADWKAYMTSSWDHHWDEPLAKRLAREFVRLPYAYTLGIFRRDLPRARMMASGDFFLGATPDSTARHRRLVASLVGQAAAEKVRFMPLAVNFHFRFDAGDRKHDEVIAVGNWELSQKRPRLLMRAIELAAARREGTRFRIFGRITEEMEQWHGKLAEGLRGSVILEGMVPNEIVAEAGRRARAMLVSAAYEGCHNASAEAICSGSCVVGVDSPLLGCLKWHASHDSGTMAPDARPESLATALCAELEKWDRGERDPVEISRYWRGQLHPDRVASSILELFGLKPPTPLPA
jgi:hypothetical protein